MPARYPESFDPLLRKPAAVWLVFFLGFIFYGSLYPFNFVATAQSLDLSFSGFSPFRDRADAIDNTVLFVPLGLGIYFWLPRWAGRVALGLTLWLVFGFGIQLAQLYLPTRIASLEDAFWNAVGMGVGLAAARAISPLLSRNRASQGYATVDRYALVLVALWICYESFPFLPTLDVSALRAHVKSFVFAPPFEWMRFTHHCLAGLLGTLAALRSGVRAPRWLLLGVLAGGVLVVEVFAAYGSLRRESLAGILAGMLIAERVEYFAKDRCRYAAFAAALGLFLITVLTPFKDQVQDGQFSFTPFSRLLWHGITKEIPPTAAEMLAIGAMLWAGTAGRGVFAQKPAGWIAVVLFLVLALELVRVGFVGYHGDTTPLAMAIMLAAALLGLRDPPASAAYSPPGRYGHQRGRAITERSET